MAANTTRTRPRGRKTPVWLRSLKESGLVYGFGALLVAVATWFTYQFIEPAPPRTLSIASGTADGAYRGFAVQLQERLAADGVDLKVIETSGSVDNLTRLASGAVDIAFMQSGLVEAERHPGFESLGALYFEPVWIFTQPDLPLGRVTDLSGKTVAVGGAGSGSRRVAVQLLSNNGLSDDDIRLSDSGGLDAVKALEEGRIDALISVSSIDSPMIQRLLGSAKVQLATLQRAPAYARREPWLTHLTLPEGVVDLARNVPARTVDLLAVYATLVSTSELHPALRDLLMQAIHDVFQRPSILSANNRFPQATGSDFPLAAAADRYYESGPPLLQRYLPFWVANLVDRLKLLALPLLALLLPLSRMLPPAYRWSVRKKVYRWYEQIQDIDLLAIDDDSPATLHECLEKLKLIEDDVREVEVPLSYAHELYVLRQHIELLIRQLEQRLSVAP